MAEKQGGEASPSLKALAVCVELLLPTHPRGQVSPSLMSGGEVG